MARRDRPRRAVRRLLPRRDGPETTLSIGAGIVQDLPDDQCQPTWDHEFLVPDYLKFADIARSGRPVADMHDATGGRPERSPRWREYSAATGFRAEVRAAFTVDGATWGIGQFNRLGDAPRFTDDEKAWLERVAPLIARGAAPGAAGRARGGPRGPRPGHGAAGPPTARVCRPRARPRPGSSEIDPAAASGEARLDAARSRRRVRRPRPRGDEDEAAVPRARVRTRTRRLAARCTRSLLEGTDQLALIIEPAKAPTWRR